MILLDAAEKFGQRVSMNYAPQGLRYELQLGLSDIETSTKQGGDGDLSDTRAAGLVAGEGELRW
jgi:hypothetical protein